MSNIHCLFFFQVDLSDSESEEAGIESADKEDAMGRRKGDLGVNKKGTPLYSREDIREQYCINDKELQVLDKTGRKGILGCFSNNGQVSLHIKIPGWKKIVLLENYFFHFSTNKDWEKGTAVFVIR